MIYFLNFHPKSGETLTTVVLFPSLMPLQIEASQFSFFSSENNFFLYGFVKTNADDNRFICEIRVTQNINKSNKSNYFYSVNSN